MNKKIIAFAIALILFVNVFLVFGEEKKEDEKKKEEYLKNIGFPIGADSGIQASDVEINYNKNEITLKKSISDKYVLISKIKGEFVIIMPEGGVLTKKAAAGAPGIIEKKQNFYSFVFGKNSRVSVKDGEVVVKDIRLERGSLINFHSVEGEIKKYDKDKGIYTTKKGKKFVLNGASFNPGNQNGLELDNDGVINTLGKDAVVNRGNEYFGRLNGKAMVSGDKNIFLILMGEEKTPAIFVNDKESKFSVTGTTSISKGQQENIFLQGLQGDSIQYNGDLAIFTSKSSSNKIDINAKDGAYDNILVKKRSSFGDSTGPGPKKIAEGDVAGNWKVSVNLERAGEKGSEKTIIDFSREKVESKGTVSGLKTNLGHMIEETGKDGNKVYTPWMIYNGQQITGKEIGKVYGNDPFKNLENIKDDNAKELFIKSLNINELKEKNLIESASKYVQGNPKLQDMIISQLSPSVDLLKLVKDNPEVQKRIIDKLGSIVFKDELVSGLQDTKGNSELQQMLLERYDKRLLGTDVQSILKSLEGDPNYAKLKDSLASKVDGILDIEKFSSLSSEEKKKEIEKLNFYSGKSLVLAFEAIKDDKELQNLILNKMQQKIESNSYLVSLLKFVNDNPEAVEKIFKKYSSDNPVLEKWTPEQVRQAVLDLSPSSLAKVLGYAKDNMGIDRGLFVLIGSTNPGWDSEKMAKIYSDSNFLEKTKNMDNTERWSVGLSAIRMLERQGMEINSKNIGDSVGEIVLLREQVKDRIIIGPETNYIPISFKGEGFNNEELVKLARDAGVKDKNIVGGLVGKDSKDASLSSIASSKGDTTIHFNAHGSNSDQALEGNDPAKTTSYNPNNPNTIGYTVLGDALIKRSENGERLSNVNIIFDSCYSYAYAKELYSYLYGKGVKDMPTIITTSNYEQVSWMLGGEYTGGITSSSVYSFLQTKASGKPLTMSDVFKSENVPRTFKKGDSAVFVPTKNGITPIGSSGNGVQKNIDTPKSIIQPDVKLVPGVIEIGKVEDAMAKELTYA